MGEIKEEINWEIFLDNYFSSSNATTTKNVHKQGLSLNYESNDIYVYCDLDLNRKRLKKLEFGRMVLDIRNQKESNWIKGVFKNDEPNHLIFLQTSWLGEDGLKYEAEFNESNKKIISDFLNTPCYIGWTEKEYSIKDRSYKIIVEANGIPNSITLMDIGEQDIPMLPDKFDQWLRVKVYDASWNNKRRIVKNIIVKPMNI